MLIDRTALVSRLPAHPVTRFAPSPTGYLHLGHVANAIMVWGIARAMRGRVLLRIEDHDRRRSRPLFAAAILDDLDWLGFVPDSGRTPVVRQSDRPERYAAALAGLRQSHHVYACTCSRKDIGGERYDGRCRRRGVPETATQALRVEMADGIERGLDVLAGALDQAPAEQCGDLLLRDRDGHWTYQFAVTVDDVADDVTLIVRGADLVSSTGRQLRLAAMLGRRTPPIFLHHRLLFRPDGRKLSKSTGDTGIRDLRRAGVHAPDVIGRAAVAMGLIDAFRPLPAAEVPRLFTLDDTAADTPVPSPVTPA